MPRSASGSSATTYRRGDSRGAPISQSFDSSPSRCKLLFWNDLCRGTMLIAELAGRETVEFDDTRFNTLQGGSGA